MEKNIENLNKKRVELFLKDKYKDDKKVFKWPHP